MSQLHPYLPVRGSWDTKQQPQRPANPLQWPMRRLRLLSQCDALLLAGWQVARGPACPEELKVPSWT